MKRTYFALLFIVASSDTNPQTYYLINNYSGRRLYARSNSNWESDVGAGLGTKYDDQKWYVDRVTGSGSGSSIKYYLRNAHSDRRLYARAGHSWESNYGAAPASSHHYPDQKWVFEAQSDGTFHIKNAQSGRRIFARSKGSWDSHVGAGPDGDTVYEDNKWRIESTKDGSPFLAVRIEHGEIRTKAPTQEPVVSKIEMTNDSRKGGEVLEKEYTYEYQVGRTQSFHASGTLSVEVVTSIEAKVSMGFASATSKLSVGVTASATVGGGTEWNETTKTSVTTRVRCAPQKRLEVLVMQTQNEMTIPLIAVYPDGAREDAGELVVKDALVANVVKRAFCLRCGQPDASCTCGGCDPNDDCSVLTTHQIPSMPDLFNQLQQFGEMFSQS